MNRPNSDFHNIKDSGKACVSCGRTGDVVPLKKLRTYAVSLACFECFAKYATCAYVSPLGVLCNHEPHPKGPCQHCGCQYWQHGLETEYDRQLAACVGKAPTAHQCRGFANRKCENVVLMGMDGEVPPLCSSCAKEWHQGVMETMRAAKQLIDLDENKEVPN